MYYRMCPAASRVKVSGTISRAQRYTQPRELGAVWAVGFACVCVCDCRVCRRRPEKRRVWLFGKTYWVLSRERPCRLHAMHAIFEMAHRQVCSLVDGHGPLSPSSIADEALALDGGRARRHDAPYVPCAPSRRLAKWKSNHATGRRSATYLQRSRGRVSRIACTTRRIPSLSGSATVGAQRRH